MSGGHHPRFPPAPIMDQYSRGQGFSRGGAGPYHGHRPRMIYGLPPSCPPMGQSYGPPRPNFSAPSWPDNPTVSYHTYEAGPSRGGYHAGGWAQRGECRGGMKRGPSPGYQHNKPKRCRQQNKRDRPEDNNFFCDTCDRGFKTQEKFCLHVSEHEKCRVEGCSYIAAPKLVQLHFQMQHKTGLAKKIWQLESQTDIAKWIAERKRNYPTAENKARKANIMKERMERGEVLETQTFSKMRGRGGQGRGGQGRGGRRGRRGRHGGRRGRRYNNEQGNEEECKDSTSDKMLSMDVDPLSYLAADSDDEPQEKIVPQLAGPSNSSEKEKPQSNPVGGLNSLLASYGDITDSEEEEGEIKDDPVPEPVLPNPMRPTLPPPQTKPESITNPSAQSNATASLSHQQHIHQSNTTKPSNPLHPRDSYKKGNQRKRSHGQQKWQQPKAKPTLLQKLLAPDIRHERNIILQCVKYIVKNNFFGLKVEEKRKPMGVTEKNSNEEHFDKERFLNDDIWEDEGVVLD